MIWDDDVNVEGASEAIYFKTKTATQTGEDSLPFNLPFQRSLRGQGRSALFGGQIQADWQANTRVSGNVNVGYYNWNQVRPGTLRFWCGNDSG